MCIICNSGCLNSDDFHRRASFMFKIYMIIVNNKHPWVINIIYGLPTFYTPTINN